MTELHEALVEEGEDRNRLELPSIEPAANQIYAEPAPSDYPGKPQTTQNIIKESPKNNTQENPTQRRSIFHLVKWAVIVLILTGIAGAYMNGTLDPVLASPGVKASMQTFSDLTQPYLLKLSEKIPVLTRWISPLPSLEDVTPGDYEALRSAVMQKGPAGPKIAIAISTSDVFAPAFYVSSNLPDGAVIDVYIEGIPDTLLNQLAFHGKAQATLQKKLGKTAPVHFTDGKAMPRGDYVIHATENPQQPDEVKALLANLPPIGVNDTAVLPKVLKLLVSKPAFLGGNKDAIYFSRLKEFHDKLRAKATTEITEIKQLAATLEGQLTQTTEKYSQLKGLVRGGKPSFAAHKAWTVFNDQWSMLDGQLQQSYAKWTEPVLETEYFYGVLYSMTKAAGEAIGKLHQLHGAFFNGKTDIKTIEIQRGGSISIAENAVSALKNKIIQVENLGPTANGMPRRDGL